jgi:glycosyltransferase involved in cell wall biosynthesis
MKVLFIVPKIDPSIGWGRYAYVIREGLIAAGHEVKLVHEVTGRELHSPFFKYFHPSWCWLADRRTIQEAIDTYDPDIVHLITEPYIFLVPFISVRRAKLIYTGHGTYAYPITVMNRSVVKPVYRWLFAQADKKVSAYIVAGTYVRDLLSQRAREGGLAIAPERIRLVPHGVDASAFHFRERSYPQQPARILTVGQVKSRKGIREAVRACAELKKRGVLFSYHIVGAYDDAQGYVQDLRRDIAQYGLEKDVVLCGRLSESDKEREYDAADVFVLLPIDDRGTVEGYGLVYLEANACGIPAIGSLGSGAQDAIQDGVSGYLVDPRSSESVADAITRIVKDGAIGSSQARAWAESHDIATWTRDTIAVYEQA